MVWMVEMVWKVKSSMFVSNLLFETITFSREPCALSLELSVLSFYIDPNEFQSVFVCVGLWLII